MGDKMPSKHRRLVWRNYTYTPHGLREWGMDFVSLSAARIARGAWPWRTTTRRAVLCDKSLLRKRP